MQILFKVPLIALLFTLSSSSLIGQTFEIRKQQYIDSALANPNGSSIVIQAFAEETVTQSELDSLYVRIPTQSTIDFELVKLVRVMFLGGEIYDSQILPEVNQIPYWINNYDTIRSFWSENHESMWMSSDWLIHERTGRPIDNSLEQRLKHYLHLKVNYGFYEFFSSTYAPFCLTGLLNLADFAEDVEIKTLAATAAKRLLSDILLVANDRGVYFPAAGRNYTSRYGNPYGHNHSSLIYLLTGLGQVPTDASHAGAFLATSSVDFSDVGEAWVAELDTTLSIGHTLEEGFVINQNMTTIDRTAFQWSSGAYFHPDVVYETVQLLEDSNMWNHVDFELLAPVAGFPLESYPEIAEGLSELTMSSGIFGQDVSIFKNGRVTLASIQDFWKGKIGFQQWPGVANVGLSAVYTSSGYVDEVWGTSKHDNANEHLPYVEQSSNVALIMYRPEEVSPILPFHNTEVALFWHDTAFSEIVEDDLWLIGRQEDGYVAARRSCIGEINGHRACPTVGGQTWVIVVGNEDMYGSFSSFQNLISQSQFMEEWLVTVNGDSTYHASIDFDTTHIEHYWDPLEYVGIADVESNHGIKVWPNPATDILNVELTDFSTSLEMTIVDLAGREIWNSSTIHPSTSSGHAIDVSAWSSGMYFLNGSNESGEKFAVKLLKQ